MHQPDINLAPEDTDQEMDGFIEQPTRKKRWPWIVAGVVVLLFFIKIILFPGSWAGTVYGGSMLHPSRTTLLQSVKNYIFDPSNVLEGEKDDRINILLLGIGGEGHDGPFLTDTNIIVSLKPSTKEISLISVPRDLSVQIPNQGWRKINSADAFGEAEDPGQGGDYTRKLFEKTFNISIPYYVRVDFKAFEEMVDEVGGVTVDVPRSFTDYQFPGMNQYHIEDTSYQTISFTQGMQTMNGEKALQFARSRHGNNGEGSDFARAHRQQLVIDALKEKLLSSNTLTNPTTMQSIWDSLNSHVATNLNLGQLLYLASVGKDYKVTHNLVLDNSPGGFLVDSIGENGAYLLSPRTGNFLAINEAINDIFTATTTTSTVLAAETYTTPSPSASLPTTVSSSARVEIQNGTWRAGIAGRLEKQLEDQHYTVLSISNAIKRPIDNTVIYVINSPSSSTTLALSSELHAPIATVLPEWLSDEYTSPQAPSSTAGIPKYNKSDDYLIILGSDYNQ